MMAVQDTQAPGREDQQAGAWKQDANDLDRQLALRAGEPGRNRRNKQRRGQHAGKDQYGHDDGEERGDGAGNPIGHTALATRDQRRVHRNEGRRQGAFAEQVLEEVRNAERGVERVGGVGLEAEVVGEDPQADQPGQTAAQDSGRDEKRRTASCGPRRP